MSLDQAIRAQVEEAVTVALARELPQHLARFQQPPDPDRCLTLEDAAAYMGVTVSTIRGGIRSGDLAAIKFGKYTVIPHRSIQALVTRELDRQRFAADQARAAAQAEAMRDVDDDIADLLGIDKAPPRPQRVSTTATKQRGHRSNGAPQGS